MLQGKAGLVELIDPWLDRRIVHTTVFSYGEVIEFYLGQSNFVQRREALVTLLGGMNAYSLTPVIVERYAMLRRQMRADRLGLIGDVDTLIAATAIEHRLTLVTTDRDFL